MRVRRAVQNGWLLAGLMALLAACGAPKTQTVQGDPPGEFAVQSIVAYCVGGTDAGIRVSWSEAAGALSYLVIRDGEQIADLGATARSFDDVSGLKPTAAPGYVIRAGNAFGNFDSAEESLSVPADLCDTADPGKPEPEKPEPEKPEPEEPEPEEPQPEIPLPPGPLGALTAELRCAPDLSVQLTWPAVANAERLVLERDYVNMAELDATEVSWADTDVAAARSYTYVLRALNETGLAISAPVSVDISFDNCGLAGPMVASYDRSTLLIANDGSLWALGENTEGQLGQGDIEERTAPVQVAGVPRMVAVAVGEQHQLALDENGRIWAWGDNDSGQLGLGFNTNQRTVRTMLPTLDDVIAIAAGAWHSLAVRADGTVWAWGDNYSGQVGQPTTGEIFEPLQVMQLSGINRVAAGYGTSFAIHADGSVLAWGSNYYGELGLGDDASRFVPERVTALPAGVASVAAGYDYTIFLLADGTVWTTGIGRMLGLGAGQADSLEPVQVPGLADIVTLPAGSGHALALRADGTLLGWGDNSGSQLGPDLASTVHEPVTLQGVPNARELAVGNSHSILVSETGQVYAWGDNEDDQLGLNPPEKIRRFTEHPLQGEFLSIAGTDSHALALLADGSVWSWDYSSIGALGLGADWANGDATGPQQIDILNGITHIAVGEHGSLALDSTGNVWSWGWHAGSGHPDATNRDTPEQIASLSGVTAIARGDDHGLAIGPGGSVWAWGRNFSGQIGDGTTDDRLTPVEVSLPEPAVAVAAGYWFSAAVLEDGSVWTWGRRNGGVMGDGGDTTGLQPLPIRADVADVTDVAAGFNTVWALHDDGTVSAWG